MKLIRTGEVGKEIPGLLEDSKKYDVSAFGEDYDENFFETDGLKRLQEWFLSNKNSCPVISEDVRLGPPFKRPSKLVCIGLNYVKHAEETGATIPKEPVLFFKSTTSIVGPNDDLIIPKDSTKTDWEVELAFVIGKRASYVAVEDAMEHVAGYVLHNDYSEREFQLEREGQWVKGKSCDSFAPLGPFMATKEEIQDPHTLRLWLKLNGKIMQDSNTSDFVFSIPQIISNVSKYMTLLPGDVISTGTPFGVGLGLKPPVYLKPGDEIELGIDGLGRSKQIARAYTE